MQGFISGLCSFALVYMSVFIPVTTVFAFYDES